MKLDDDGFCFACGKNNDMSLRLEFEYNDGEARCVFVPKKEHQGWKDVIHGGILATVMDEAMAKLIINDIAFGVTSNMEIRFLRPAKVGEELTVTASIKKVDGKNVNASSVIKNSKNKVVASSKACYVLMKLE